MTNTSSPESDSDGRLDGPGPGDADPGDADPGGAHPGAEGVRVRTHPSLCVGLGQCHRWAPEVYPLDEDGMIAIHKVAVPPELAHKAWLGASLCSEQAITVIGPPEEYWLRRRADNETLGA